MMKPNVLIFAGYGLNCEQETAFAFRSAGAKADIVHINDLIEDKRKILKYQIMAIPGGFAYGDDLGAGRAYALKMKNHLSVEIKKFAEQDRLIIGICNGFQILTQFGLLPGALVANERPRYNNRWVDLEVKNNSPWFLGISRLSCPIAHGEGKFVLSQKDLKMLQKKKMIALKYSNGDICKFLELPANPNGSLQDIAGITDESGRILGLMPHPERAIFFAQFPDWTYRKELYIREKKEIPTNGPSLQIFKNAIKYFE